MDSGRSMKNLIQSENNFFQSINKLEAQMSCYINIVKYRNEKTLPNTYYTIPDCPSHIEGMKNLGVLETLIKTQFHHTNLNLTNSKSLTNWQVFHSIRLNLNVNVTSIPNLVIQFSSSNLCWIRYPYQIWINFLANIFSRTYRSRNWITKFG